MRFFTVISNEGFKLFKLFPSGITQNELLQAFLPSLQQWRNTDSFF